MSVTFLFNGLKDVGKTAATSEETIVLLALLVFTSTNQRRIKGNSRCGTCDSCCEGDGAEKKPQPGKQWSSNT